MGDVLFSLSKRWKVRGKRVDGGVIVGFGRNGGSGFVGIPSECARRLGYRCCRKY